MLNLHKKSYHMEFQQECAVTWLCMPVHLSTTMFCLATDNAQPSQEKLPHVISAGMCCNMVVYAISFKYHDVLFGYR